MSGGAFLSIASLVCLAVFLCGAAIARRSQAPDIPLRLYDRPLDQTGKLQMLHNIGHVCMVAAALFWLLFLAMSFGYVEPLHNIQPIALG